MSILWPLLLVMCAGLLLALALKCGEAFAPGTVVRSRSFWCPFRARNVRVDFEETAWDARRVDVCRCSAFAPPTDVGCDKACLTLDAFPAQHRTLPL
jgi:hypothetical protein